MSSANAGLRIAPAVQIGSPAMTEVNAASSDAERQLRLVLSGMLIGLLWKLSYFAGADHVYASVPLQDNFFPVWLQQAASLRLAYLTAALAISIAWFVRSLAVRRAALLLSGSASTVMLLHQGSYNDMTFTTLWWCHVWALWISTRIGTDPDDRLHRKAAFLSRLMLSVVLLGGAVGKWTGEYWSGEVFYEIYFRDRDFWVFNLLRLWFDAETLAWIAMAYSRKVILVETIAGLVLWLMPPRWAALTGVVIFSSIALLSNWLLFSVLAPLIGLSLVGWYVRR